MHGLTIGQVFALFEGMSRYVILTSPWGSSDGTAAGPQSDVGLRDHVRADQNGATQRLAASGAFGTVGRISIDQVPNDIKDLLS